MRRSVAPLEAAPREGLREGFDMLCLGFSPSRPYLPCAAIGLHAGTPHMSRNERHVVPHGDDDWAVKAPHVERPSGIFPTQQDAIDRARQILRNDGGGELVIHRPDGSIRDSDTVPPGNDPFPPRG